MSSSEADDNDVKLAEEEEISSSSSRSDQEDEFVETIEEEEDQDDQPGFFIIVAAVKSTRGIGMKGKMPWNIPRDLKHFKNFTTDLAGNDPNHNENVVIMGRKTYVSLPESKRPLPGRMNIVITRDPHNYDALAEGLFVVGSLKEALEHVAYMRKIYDQEVSDQQIVKSETHIKRPFNTFVIGGGEIYKIALGHPKCNQIVYTEIDKFYECDTFFPVIDANVFVEDPLVEPYTHEEDSHKLTFKMFIRKELVAEKVVLMWDLYYEEKKRREANADQFRGALVSVIIMLALSLFMFKVFFQVNVWYIKYGMLILAAGIAFFAFKVLRYLFFGGYESISPMPSTPPLLEEPLQPDPRVSKKQN